MNRSPRALVSAFVCSVPEKCRLQDMGVADKIAAQVKALTRRFPSLKLTRPHRTSAVGRAIEMLIRGAALALSAMSGSVYVRYDAYVALPILVLGVLGKRVVVEMNGRLSEEVTGWKRWAQALLDRVTLPGVYLVVAVAQDVESYVETVVGHGKRRPLVSVVPNAVEASADYVPRLSSGKPTLLYLGTYRRSHGLDLLIRALMEDPLSDVHLILAGEGPGEPEIKEQVKLMGLGNRVQFLGWVRSQQLPAIVAASDLGVGPLSTGIVGLQTASALKVRTYLGYGLPSAVGYLEDPEMMRQPFVFHISEEPDRLASQMAEAVSTCRMQGNDLRLKAWQYARNRLSYDVWVDRIAALLGNDGPMQRTDQ